MIFQFLGQLFVQVLSFVEGGVTVNCFGTPTDNFSFVRCLQNHEVIYRYADFLLSFKLALLRARKFDFQMFFEQNRFQETISFEQ